ncbi:PAS domain-containing protein, partial [bacterium]|nr:PAS domain-containing protein [bacterium]
MLSHIKIGWRIVGGFILCSLMIVLLLTAYNGITHGIYQSIKRYDASFESVKHQGTSEKNNITIKKNRIAVLVYIEKQRRVFIGYCLAAIFICLMSGYFIRKSIDNSISNLNNEVLSLKNCILEGKMTETGNLDNVDPEFQPMLMNTNIISAVLLSHLNAFNVFFIDKKFNILYMTRALCQLLGTEPKDVMGKKCHAILNSAVCKTKNCSCAKSMTSGEIVRTEAKAFNIKGEELKLSKSACCLKDKSKPEGQQIIGAVEFIIDMTEVKNLQEQVQCVSSFQKNEIKKLTDLFGKLSSGNFCVEYDISEKNDTIAESHENFIFMKNKIDEMIKNLSELIHNIREDAGDLDNASEKLRIISEKMHAESSETSNQAENVACTTEEMSRSTNSMASTAEEISVNLTTVSSGATQMSQNMNVVAEAIEEMVRYIENVTNCANDASTVAETAMNMSKTATDTMKDLGNAANEIGKVTEVIKRIAEQTNLLALNATIEAASAGEAGRGFAVVAKEIKELANQSAQAAEDIASRIKGVQGNTDNAVKVIDNVAEIINTINESVSTISNAVEMQTKASNEISYNVIDANKSAANIAASISEIAKGTTDMSTNIGEAA